MVRKEGGAGFTLLELLIVVIIIGILASVALPGFGKAVRKARSTEGQTVVSAMLTAEFLYYLEHRTFASGAANLMVDLPPSESFAYSVQSASATQAMVQAQGTGPAFGIQVQGSISDRGQRTITVTGLES